jgi:glyoxylate/hydroxypyruvate reductase
MSGHQLSAKFTIISPSSPLSTSTQAVLILGSMNPVHQEFLDQYPSLRCAVTTSTGVNHIDLDACAKRGILVANVGETFSKDVADYALGLLIDAMRRITMSDQYIRKGFWVKRGSYPLGSKVRFFGT